jgi:hypothetical protein
MRQKWDKKVSRSKEARSDMEEKDEGKVLREVEHWKTIKEGLATIEVYRSQAIGSRESQAQGSGTQSGIADQRIKKEIERSWTPRDK